MPHFRRALVALCPFRGDDRRRVGPAGAVTVTPPSLVGRATLCRALTALAARGPLLATLHMQRRPERRDHFSTNGVAVGPIPGRSLRRGSVKVGQHADRRRSVVHLTSTDFEITSGTTLVGGKDAPRRARPTREPARPSATWDPIVLRQPGLVLRDDQVVAHFGVPGHRHRVGCRPYAFVGRRLPRAAGPPEGTRELARRALRDLERRRAARDRRRQGHRRRPGSSDRRSEPGVIRLRGPDESERAARNVHR